MTAVAVLFIAGLAAWMLRAGFIVLDERASLPPLLERVVAQARPAFLAALVTSGFVAQGHGDPIAVPVSWLGAVVAGVVVSRRGGGLLATGVAGIVAVTLLSAAGL